MNRILTQNIILGESLKKAIDALAKKMKTSKVNAGRLVMTEEAFFSSAAQKDCLKELEVEHFEVVVTLDSHTCSIFQPMDGKIFPMKEFEPGVTAPPYHVGCRCCTCPSLEDNFGVTGKRAAKGQRW